MESHAIRSGLPLEFEHFNQNMEKSSPNSKPVVYVITTELYFAALTYAEACALWNEDMSKIFLLGDLLAAGPLTLESIQRFVERLCALRHQNPSGRIVFCAAPADRAPLDGVISLGCYTIQMLGWSPRRLCEGMRTFSDPQLAIQAPELLSQHLGSSISMSTPCTSAANPRLRVLDVWVAYHRAVQLGWTGDSAEAPHPALPAKGAAAPPRQCNSMRSPTLHFVVPGQLAMYGGSGTSPCCSR